MKEHRAKGDGGRSEAYQRLREALLAWLKEIKEHPEKYAKKPSRKL